jgi:hypothetical protein
MKIFATGTASGSPTARVDEDDATSSPPGGAVLKFVR